MTQNLLGFNDLPVGALVSLPLVSQGTLGYGRVVPSTSSSMLLTDRNVRYVDEGGSDATGDGSRTNPFRTVQPAIDACVAAGAALVDPFCVRVSPGASYGTFTLRPHVYVVGSGNSPGSYNASPLTGPTILAPNAAQALGTGWTGGGLIKSSGIFNASLANALVVDFNAIGSGAANQFILQDVTTESAITFTGSGNAEYATVRNVYINSASNFTSANMGGAVVDGLINDFAGGIVLTQSAALQSFYEISGSQVGSFSATWTSALLTNVMNISDLGGGSTQGPVTLSGAGIAYFSPGNNVVSYRLSDANHVLGYDGAVAAADIIGVDGGTTYLAMSPTAARTLTITQVPGGIHASEIVVINESGSNFIDFVFSTGTVENGCQTYCPPGYQVRILTKQVGGAGQLRVWSVLTYTQRGTVSLVNGVSAAIAADISADSAIVATLKTFNTATSFISAKPTDRVNGTRAGGGSFKLTSVTGAGATVATDQSTYDWHVIGLGSGT